MPVIGPDGLPEAFTWWLGSNSHPVASELDPQGGPDRSFLEANGPYVEWILLMPQRPGLPHHSMRVPPGTSAWFTRRRVKEGTFGGGGAERLIGSWTGIGWRDSDGNGPSVFFRDDGSSVSGVDDGTLTKPMEVTLA